MMMMMMMMVRQAQAAPSASLGVLTYIPALSIHDDETDVAATWATECTDGRPGQALAAWRRQRQDDRSGEHTAARQRSTWRAHCNADGGAPSD